MTDAKRILVFNRCAHGWHNFSSFSVHVSELNPDLFFVFIPHPENYLKYDGKHFIKNNFDSSYSKDRNKYISTSTACHLLIILMYGVVGSGFGYFLSKNKTESKTCIQTAKSLYTNKPLCNISRLYLYI